jgi:hypothetical protein
MIAIIRINHKNLDEVSHDEDRIYSAGFRGIKFRIPQVRVLKKSTHAEDQFEYKPLLFNYGFMEICLDYLRNPITLNKIRQNSQVISGWFYRKPAELLEEKAERDLGLNEDEEFPLPEYVPHLVKTIKQEQLDILYAEAKKLDVYDGSEHLQAGTFIVLEKYPFNGLAAKVLRKKTNGKVQVELLDSGINIWVELGSILYTPYTEKDSYQF